MLLTRQHFIEIGQRYNVSASEAAAMFDIYENGFRKAAPPHVPMEINDRVRETIHLTMAVVATHKSGETSDEEFAQSLRKAFADRQRATQRRKPGFFARLFGRR